MSLAFTPSRFSGKVEKKYTMDYLLLFWVVGFLAGAFTGYIVRSAQLGMLP